MPDLSASYLLKVKHVSPEANDMLVVELAVPPSLTDEFMFTHGQFLTFIVQIDGEEVRRSYSICRAVGEQLAVGIKLVRGGKFTEFAHANFETGITVEVLPPDGQFTCDLDPSAAKKYLLIAAGSGITPIISIAKTVLGQEPNSQVSLIYGNRRSGDVIFKEPLLWLKNRHLERFQWINIFSQESQAAQILNGRIDNKKGAELNKHLLDIGKFDHYFLCGPEGMISEVSRGLRATGVDDSKIHYELFFASAEDAREALARQRARAKQFAGLTTQVTVKSHGREVIFELTADGENILDGAMDQGMDLPFSCKGGVCATCKARLLDGEVDMNLNHALSDDEVRDGYILTCQAHPISESVTVDFDVL